METFKSLFHGSALQGIWLIPMQNFKANI